MAIYEVNRAAVAYVAELSFSRQYVLDSDWGDVQPSADDENAYLQHHSWEEYARWHLGLTEGTADGAKARYAYVCGDFRRVHHSGLIACRFRAAQWRHNSAELAAHDLLQGLTIAARDRRRREATRKSRADGRGSHLHGLTLSQGDPPQCASWPAAILAVQIASTNAN